MFFFCLKQAAEGCGGETPLVKNKELLSKLDSAVVRKFEEKKLRYVRYLPDKSRGDYMNWQHVFFTENKEVLYTETVNLSILFVVEYKLKNSRKSYLWRRTLREHKADYFSLFTPLTDNLQVINNYWKGFVIS